MRWIAALALLGAIGFAGSSHGCGIDSDCMIGERSYRISLPELDSHERIGAIIYAHGYRGSAKSAMKNKNLRALAHAEGMAFIATKSLSHDWMIPGVPEDPSVDGLAELAYYDAVIADASTRFGIDRDRLIATGFSAGGMMVWNLACHRGASFAAFVPIAGTFWEPMPESCSSDPVNLIHIHGLDDKIVPLTGRKIRTTHQGSVPLALERAATHGAFGPETEPAQNKLDCRHQRNPAGKLLSFCTHPGGHSMRTEYLREAIEILRERRLF